MELRTLKYFLTVASELNITKAALPAAAEPSAKPSGGRAWGAAFRPREAQDPTDRRRKISGAAGGAYPESGGTHRAAIGGNETADRKGNSAARRHRDMQRQRTSGHSARF